MEARTSRSCPDSRQSVFAVLVLALVAWSWGSSGCGGDSATPSSALPHQDASTEAGGTGGSGSCKPVTCEQIGAQCGMAPDGCGSKIQCGTCDAPLFCGGNGPNRCGSTPCTIKTCAQLGSPCGLVSDGCADVIDCGGCAAPQVCVKNACMLAGTGGSATGGSGGQPGGGSGGVLQGGSGGDPDSGFGGNPDSGFGGNPEGGSAGTSAGGTSQDGSAGSAVDGTPPCGGHGEPACGQDCNADLQLCSVDGNCWYCCAQGSAANGVCSSNPNYACQGVDSGAANWDADCCGAHGRPACTSGQQCGSDLQACSVDGNCWYCCAQNSAANGVCTPNPQHACQGLDTAASNWDADCCGARGRPACTSGDACGSTLQPCSVDGNCWYCCGPNSVANGLCSPNPGYPCQGTDPGQGNYDVDCP